MSVHALSFAIQLCSTCRVEYPLTTEYFRRTTLRGSPDGWRKKCRRCCNQQVQARERELVALAKEVEAAKPTGKFVPRLAGDEGPGGYTEQPDSGVRWMTVPDSHGDLIDWDAAHGLLAFARFWQPQIVFLLGDHVDFAAFSRFDKPPTDIARIRGDIAAWKRFAGLLRESCPEADLRYRKGNHEARFAKWLWKHPEAGALLDSQDMDLPMLLDLGKHRIKWIESGSEMATPHLVVKHGHLVRMRSGYTATGELERNGLSGISGHTHRLGQIYKRSRAGMLTWIESGCICQYDPDYMEGQVSDWQQGLAFGTISGKGFTAHTAPIIKGKVRLADRAISP